MNIVLLEKDASKEKNQSLFSLIQALEQNVEVDLVLITSQKSWLTEQLEAMNLLRLEIIIEPYPEASNRLMQAWGDFKWGKRIEKQLNILEFDPQIIQANRHEVMPSALALQKIYPSAETSVFLRDERITKDIFRKFQCDQTDIPIAVNDYMRDRLFLIDSDLEVFREWPSKQVFEPAHQLSSRPPSRVLVLGNAAEQSGWKSLIQAFQHIEDSFPHLQAAHFLDVPSEQEYERMLDDGQSVKHMDLVFEEKTEDWLERVKDFDLVIAPSERARHVLDIVKAMTTGVPMLVLKNNERFAGLEGSAFEFAKQDENGLAAALSNILENWQTLNTCWKASRQAIMDSCSMEASVDELLKIYTLNQ